MAIYKPSNLSPQNEEIDVNYTNNVFECQVNTSGEPVESYRFVLYNEDATEKLYESDLIDKTVSNKHSLKIENIQGGLFNNNQTDPNIQCFYTESMSTGFTTFPYQLRYSSFKKEGSPDLYFKATTVPRDIREYCSNTKTYGIGQDGYYIETPVFSDSAWESLMGMIAYTLEAPGCDEGIPKDASDTSNDPYWGNPEDFSRELYTERTNIIKNNKKIIKNFVAFEKEHKLYWYPFFKDYYLCKIKQDGSAYILFKKETIDTLIYSQSIAKAYTDQSQYLYSIKLNWWKTGSHKVIVNYHDNDNKSHGISYYLFNLDSAQNPSLALPIDATPDTIDSIYCKINYIDLIKDSDYITNLGEDSADSQEQNRKIKLYKNVTLKNLEGGAHTQIFLVSGKSLVTGNNCIAKFFVNRSQEAKSPYIELETAYYKSDSTLDGIYPKDITSIFMIWDSCLDLKEDQVINLKDLEYFELYKEFKDPNLYNYFIKEPDYNGKNYQWNIRTYNQKKKEYKKPNTKVCDGYLTGSTKTVLWSRIPYHGTTALAKAGCQVYSDIDCTIPAKLDLENAEQLNTLGNDTECYMVNSTCFAFEQDEKIYYIKKSDVYSNKDLVDNIVYDRYVEFKTQKDEMNLGYNPEKGKTMPLSYPYKERKKIDWVTTEVGNDKDIIKVEVIDDEGNGFTYNYYDGTPYKVFTCSDKHTVKSFFADVNQNINVADYVMLYKDKEKARMASYYRQDPTHGCQKSTIPLGWNLYTDAKMNNVLKRNPWFDLKYQYQDEGDCAAVTPGKEQGQLYIESPNDYKVKNWDNTDSKKIMGYSSDTGEVRVHDPWSVQPNNDNAYRIFEKNPETGEYLEIMDDNKCYMVSSAQSLNIDKGFYCFPTILPVKAYQRFSSWGQESYQKGIPFWKHYDDMKEDLINGRTDKVVFFYKADIDFVLGGHSSYDHNGVSTIFWWGYSTIFKSKDPNIILKDTSATIRPRGNFITWIPRYGDSWNGLKQNEAQYVSITQGGNYCYDHRPSGVWALYPFKDEAEESWYSCGRYLLEAAKFSTGSKEYWIDAVEPETNQRILTKNNKGYADTQVYTPIIDKVITINPTKHFKTFEDVANYDGIKMYECFYTTADGSTFTKVSPIYSYDNDGEIAYVRAKYNSKSQKIQWEKLTEGISAPDFMNQQLYIEGNELLSLTSQVDSDTSIVRLGTPFVRVIPDKKHPDLQGKPEKEDLSDLPKIPLYELDPLKAKVDGEGMTIYKLSQAIPVKDQQGQQVYAKPGHLVYASGLIESYYPSWSSDEGHQESCQWFTYYDNGKKYYVLDGVKQDPEDEDSKPVFVLSRRIENNFTENNQSIPSTFSIFGSEFYIDTPDEYYNNNPYNKQIVGGVPIDDPNNQLKVMTHKWGGPNQEDYRIFMQPNINILPDAYKPNEIIFNENGAKINIPEQYMTIVENGKEKKIDLTFNRLDDSQWLLEHQEKNESGKYPQSSIIFKEKGIDYECTSSMLNKAYQFLTNKYYYHIAESNSRFKEINQQDSKNFLKLKSGYSNSNINGTNKYSNRYSFFKYYDSTGGYGQAIKFSNTQEQAELTNPIDPSQSTKFSMFFWRYATLSEEEGDYSITPDTKTFTLNILKNCINDIYIVFKDGGIESFELDMTNYDANQSSNQYQIQTNHAISDIKEIQLTYSSLFDCNKDGFITEDDVKAFDSLCRPPLVPKSPYTVYTCFMDSMPNAYFYARKIPEIKNYVNTISEDSDRCRSQTFLSADYILDGINMYLNAEVKDIQTSVHSYQYDLYECAQVIDLPNQKYITGGLIKSSGPIYTNDYTWSFKGLENNMAYVLRFTIEDEYNKLFTREYCFFVKYEYDESFADLQLDYDCHENAIQVTGQAPIMVKSSNYNGKTTINRDDIVKDKDYSKYKNRYLQINNDEILHYNCTSEDNPDPIYIPNDFSYLARFQISGDAIRKVQGEQEIPIANINYDKNGVNKQIDISLTSCYQYNFNNGKYGKEDHPLNLKIISSETGESYIYKYFDLPELFKQFFVIGEHLKYAGQPTKNFEAGAGPTFPSINGLEKGDHFLLTQEYKINNKTYYPGVYQVFIKEGSTIKQWVDCQDSQYIFAEGVGDFEGGVIPSGKTIGEFLSTDWEDKSKNSTTWGLQNSEDEHVWAESENNIERLSQVFDNTWFTLLIQRQNNSLTYDLSCDTQSYNI